MPGFFEGKQLVIASIWATGIPSNLSPTIDFSLLTKTPFEDRMTIRTSSASTKNSSSKTKFHFLLASKFATDS
ncbi:MAG: hypothetical protein O3A40_04295 [Bacteroidetes bacterium]|nr:hypothetical protein [Bacteroidota bacterium]